MRKQKSKKKRFPNTYKGSTEHMWLATHPMEVAKYTGQYIAVVGKKIVAHGYNFEKVYEKAKQYGENPLFDKVLDAELLACLNGASKNNHGNRQLPIRGENCLGATGKSAPAAWSF